MTVRPLNALLTPDSGEFVRAAAVLHLAGVDVAGPGVDIDVASELEGTVHVG
ncbi:hypothetical protein chiPu_0026671, partial [Chiloscyllium punctatum]|nr:hypothetical protein [Chiloscyllium punctatum]